MNKDIEGIKSTGWFFLFMVLSMKALAARKNASRSETDTQGNLSYRNDIVIGDTSEIFYANPI